jgi:GTP cyclohydrolase II
MRDFISSFCGSTSKILSKKFGALTVEAISVSPSIDGDLAVYFGNPTHEGACPLVRIHSACLFSEVFGDTFCDCADQLRIALERLKNDGGILIYWRFEGRGAGLAAKVRATALEHLGIDTYDSRVMIGVEPESREFSAVGHFLISKGIKRIKLLTNNPDKANHLMTTGLEVEVEPLVVEQPNPHVKSLYLTKRRKFGHMIPEPQVKQMDLF